VLYLAFCLCLYLHPTHFLHPQKGTYIYIYNTQANSGAMGCMYPQNMYTWLYEQLTNLKIYVINVKKIGTHVAPFYLVLSQGMMKQQLHTGYTQPHEFIYL